MHKGNGENQFISQQPPVIGSIMGNGRRRSISCPSCNGLADGNKLLAPVALTCGSDGSLYVGDFNYIRRIFPSGNVTNILELRYSVLNVAIRVMLLSSAKILCTQKKNEQNSLKKNTTQQNRKKAVWICLFCNSADFDLHQRNTGLASSSRAESHAKNIDTFLCC